MSLGLPSWYTLAHMHISATIVDFILILSYFWNAHNISGKSKRWTVGSGSWQASQVSKVCSPLRPSAFSPKGWPASSFLAKGDKDDKHEWHNGGEIEQTKKGKQRAKWLRFLCCTKLQGTDPHELDMLLSIAWQNVFFWMAERVKEREKITLAHLV